MKLIKIQPKIIVVLIISCLIQSSSPVFLNFVENNNCKNQDNICEFNEEIFELNGTRIFEIPIDDLIRKLNLNLSSTNNEIRRFEGKDCLILVNNSDELIYFEIVGKNHVIKNPFFTIDEKISCIKRKCPKLFSEIFESEFYSEKMQIISIFSKNNSELRVQVKGSRIHSFVYLSSEDQEQR
jgi:hypothetical protein